MRLQTAAGGQGLRLYASTDCRAANPPSPTRTLSQPATPSAAREGTGTDSASTENLPVSLYTSVDDRTYVGTS